MRRQCAWVAIGVLCITLATGCVREGASTSKTSGARSLEAPVEMMAQASAGEGGGTPGAAAMAGDSTAAVGAPKAPALPRKIIYTAQADLVCEDLNAAVAKIEEKVKSLGGYVSGRSLTGAAGFNRTGIWTLRLPAEKFDTFLLALPAFGELQSSNTASEDVSEEFYDVQARLKNKRVEEERLVAHLKASTGKLSEILAVEREISRVREEIERVEGRLRFLTSQTDLSTVTLTLREVRGYRPPAPPSLGTEIGRSFTNSIDTMGAALKGLTLLAVALIPWALLLGGLTWALLTLFKRFGKRGQ